MLSRRADRCLIVYTWQEWERTAERIAALPSTQVNQRRVSHLVFSGAFALELDRQGRIIIPFTLRQYAEINNEMVIVRVYSHLQIWPKQLWDAEKQYMVEHAVEISEAVTM